MIANHSYLDSGFYNGTPQTNEPYSMANRLGNLQLNSSTPLGYATRSNPLVVHTDASHNYVDTKLYDHQVNGHGHLNVMKNEFVPKEQANISSSSSSSSFKSPEIPSHVASWSTSSSVRHSSPPTSSWNAALRSSPTPSSLSSGPSNNVSTFKSPEILSQPPPWSSSSSVRHSSPAAPWNSSLRASPTPSSLSSGPSTSDAMRLVQFSSVYSRSMPDVYPPYCQTCPPNNSIYNHQSDANQNPFTGKQ